MATVSPRLAGRRIALLAADGTHDHEFWVPYYRFIEEGADLTVAGAEAGAVYVGEGRHGRDGMPLAPTTAAIGDLDADLLDGLVIPGGLFAPLRHRNDPAVLDLVRAMDRRGRILAAICHGPWVLVSAGVLPGRQATSPDDMADDMKNAGARWVRQPAVRDGHIITSVYFGYLPEFMRLVVDAIEG